MAKMVSPTHGTLPVLLLVSTLCKTIPSNILLQFNPLSQIHGCENSARLSDTILPEMCEIIPDGGQYS